MNTHVIQFPNKVFKTDTGVTTDILKAKFMPYLTATEAAIKAGGVAVSLYSILKSTIEENKCLEEKLKLASEKLQTLRQS